MNNTNVLISGDNKGYASLLHEKAMDPQSLPGHVRRRRRGRGRGGGGEEEGEEGGGKVKVKD